MGNRCLPGSGGSFRSRRSRSFPLADVQVTALGQPRPLGALPVPRRAEGEGGGEGGERRGTSPRAAAAPAMDGAGPLARAAARPLPGGARDTALLARVGPARAGGTAVHGFRFLWPGQPTQVCKLCAPRRAVGARGAAWNSASRASMMLGKWGKKPATEGKKKRGRKCRVEGLARSLFVLHQPGVWLSPPSTHPPGCHPMAAVCSAQPLPPAWAERDPPGHCPGWLARALTYKGCQQLLWPEASQAARFCSLGGCNKRHFFTKVHIITLESAIYTGRTIDSLLFFLVLSRGKSFSSISLLCMQFYQCSSHLVNLRFECYF